MTPKARFETFFLENCTHISGASKILRLSKLVTYKYMSTQYVFQSVEVPSKIRTYIEKKITSVQKLLKDDARAEVEIAKNKNDQFRVEIMIHTPRDEFRANEVSETIEASVDLIEDELKRQIRHKMEKLETLKRRGGRSLKKKMVVDDSARF